MENTPNTVTTPVTNNKMLELFKKHLSENENVKVLSPAEAQKEEELAKSKKRNLSMLSKCLKAMGIKLTVEEQKNLEDFFTRGDIIENTFDIIRFLPSANRLMKQDENSEDLEFNGENGIYALIHTDVIGQRICKVCYPALDVRLRPIDFKYRLKIALEDWIIYLKGLKVQGSRINTGFIDRGKENGSDKEYLQKVSRKMMASETIAKVIDVICQSGVYDDIQVNAVVYSFDANGNSTKNYLFSMDPVAYSTKMGASANVNHRFDMIQGDVEVIDLPTKNGEVFEYRKVACIDPEQPSLYLHKGRNGFNINLYIPEEIMQVFFEV